MMLGRFATLGGAVERDPYFNVTTLLLPGNGTNGAQNNTFVDSGTANGGVGFPVTRNPSAGPNAPTQGTFSPFSSGWSVFLDGISTIARPAGLQTAFAGWGGRTRTWECWVYRAGATDYSLQTAYNSSADNGRWTITIASNKLRFGWTTSTSTETSVSTTATVPVGWVYLSVTVDSTTSTATTIYLGINGTVETFTGNNLSTQTTTYGWQNLFASAAFQPAALTGYFTGLRWSNNLRYTSNYAVPTQPLTNDGNTLFLFGQRNRFVDESSNVYAITVGTGTPAVQPFRPFAPINAYTTTDVGGSVYFDGTDDYLEVNGGSSLAFGSGDFSLEAFVYPTTSGDVRKIYDARDGSATNCPLLDIDTDNTARFFVDGTELLPGRTIVIPANAWTHILVSRVSGNLRMFINGVQDGSAVSNATNFANPTARPQIGVRGTSPKSDRFTGYISNLRVLIGSGFTSVTVPTAPPSPVGSSLCLNFTNAGITDVTAKNVLETVGNAQIATGTYTPTATGTSGASTITVSSATGLKLGQSVTGTGIGTNAVITGISGTTITLSVVNSGTVSGTMTFTDPSKFGGSIYFDGTGDYLMVKGTPGGRFSTSNSGGYTFGTGPFTFEVWVFITSLSTGPVIIDNNPGADTTGTGRFMVDVTSAGLIRLLTGAGGVLTSGGTVTTNTWHHIAVTRDSGSTARIFLNGAVVNTPISVTTNFQTKPIDRPVIGVNAYDVSSQIFTGYINGLRITNGVARYTANFPLPTAAFPTQ